MKDGETKDATSQETGAEERVKNRDNDGSSGRDVEKLRRIRLGNLLRELVDKEGRKGTADMLGVHYRTLVRALDSGRITGRMSDALHILLGRREPPDVARLTGQMGALEFRVKKLEKKLQEAATEEEVNAGSAMEARGEDGVEFSPTVEGLRSSRQLAAVGRRDPEVVAEEPSPGDDALYGDAWPLVEEWRDLRAVHPEEGRDMSWLEREHRILTLELSMLEQHGLTLPPEDEPLRGFARRDQTSWRREALGDAGKAIARKRLLQKILKPWTWWR